MKTIWYHAPSKGHRETQLSLWNFVSHHYFMKYLSDKWRGECIFRGGARGWSRMPGRHVDCRTVRVSIALAMSQTKYSRIHSCSGTILGKIKWFWLLWLLYKMLMDNVIPIKCLEWYKEHVSYIEFRFGLGDFYCRFLSQKCHNVVTVDCFHSNMHPCHYTLQQKSMKSSFVWNFLKMIKKIFCSLFEMSRQIRCRSIYKAMTFVL